MEKARLDTIHVNKQYINKTGQSKYIPNSKYEPGTDWELLPTAVE